MPNRTSMQKLYTLHEILTSFSVFNVDYFRSVFVSVIIKRFLRNGFVLGVDGPVS